MVYGVPESQSKDRDNRKTHDKVHFQTICQEGLDMDVDVSDTVRLGEKKEGRNRPLCVKLSDEAEMRRVLRQAKNLARAEDELLKEIFIRKDMTPMERKEDYELRKRLKTIREESSQNGDGIRWIIRRGDIVNATPSDARARAIRS